MKSLIIYFSHTGENYMSDGIRNIDKGNTEIVAEKINEIKTSYEEINNWLKEIISNE